MWIPRALYLLFSFVGQPSQTNVLRHSQTTGSQNAKMRCNLSMHASGKCLKSKFAWAYLSLGILTVFECAIFAWLRKVDFPTCECVHKPTRMGNRPYTLMGHFHYCNCCGYAGLPTVVPHLVTRLILTQLWGLGRNV